ncbi:MAG: hypothetical protein L0H83_14585, partial [Salinisphaera sp.]|nr:hypothetical protein [Salinisphaera sp.]
MQFRNLIAPMFACALLAACSSSSNSDEPGTTPPLVQAIVADFDPANGVIPFPNNLLFSGTTDLTVNIPVANATDYGDPAVAINTLDGFSTVAPWSTTFSAPVDPTSLVGGETVYVFEVTLASPAGAVTSVVRELESPEE